MLDYKDYVGGVPVIVHLKEQDIVSLARRPPPLAFVLPRTTLLIAILRDVLEFFSPYGAVLNQYTTQVWFSYESMVVPWGYPVGAVRDFVVELQRIQRRWEHDDPKESTDPISLSHPLHGEQAKGGAADVDYSPPIFSFSSEPLELDFRIYQPSSFKTIERCAPFLVNFDRLDDYIRNEIKQLHKMAYAAIYGSYKSYLNAPESVLQAAIGMALYRPFELPSSSDFSDSSSAGSPSSLRYHSPYVLAEYQHMLRSVSRARRLAYGVRLGVPWAYRAGRCGPVLRLDTYRVGAAPAIPQGFAGGKESGDKEGGGGKGRFPAYTTDPAGVLDSADAPPSASATEQARSTRQPLHEAEDLVDPDDEALTLGLLLWRLFYAPCMSWKLSAPTASSATSLTGALPTTEAVVAVDGIAIDENMILRSMSVFYTDPPASATTDSGEYQTLSFSEQRSDSWALWEASMTQRFIEVYEGPADKSSRVGAILGIPIAAEKEGEANQEYEPQRLFFKIQGILPSLRTPANFLETYMTSSDRSLYVIVMVQ